MAETDEDDGVDSLIAAVARIPVQAAQAWTPPSELDEYKLIRPLGRGGMGSVWLAEDTLLQRLVAIKFIAHGEPDLHTRERFAIEARAAARLSHQNVVTVHRFGEVAGRPYLVSEYIRGDALDKLAKPIPWQKSLELGIALARGLAAAHRHGIVHRDIKPANAILAADGDVKLVDFGLAKIGGGGGERAAPMSAEDLGTAATELTRPGTIAGTPRYMAPEVRDGMPADRRSDVYQVGCILYELCTGRAPILDAVDGRNTPLGVPDARFAAIVDRCLRRDPEERFATGDELRDALERLAAPAAGGTLPEGNPYRGLVAFDAEHRALFFGRGAEIRAVLERLRGDPFVLVTGDSGVGKSSLVRAGVLPHVVDGALGDGRAWSAATLVPGARPHAALLAALDLDDDTDLPRALRRALGTKKGLVVFIDQLEELATLAERDEAARAAHVLRQLAGGIPGVRLIATVRSDFLTRVAEPFGAEVTRALYLVPPLSEDGAREAIVGPARAKGARFESDVLVDTLVSAVADKNAIELPLLAFTLAQLWDARDTQTQTITAGSLEAIGGVHSALARHADAVLARLLPRQRDVARQLLLRLVTPERTRARRTTDQLAAFDPAVLDALVRGRLVVARGDAFELAHERLIDGWPTLAGWLTENVEAVAAHARLAAAAADWERLERARERLWGERQLVDLDKLADELDPSERAFVEASQRALRRRRMARVGFAIAIPAIIGVAYAGARFVSHRENARRVAEKLEEATAPWSEARRQLAASDAARTAAFAAFDANDRSRAETIWAGVLEQTAATRRAYAQAARALESAFLFDTSRDDVRRLLAEITYERIGLAEREYHAAEREELESRLPLYDDGTYAEKLRAPARLDLAIPNATVTLLAGGGEVPIGDGEVPPGKYTLVARAEGRAGVTLPLVLRRGEHRTLAFELPPATAVPEGFVLIPAGTFLYGSNDDDALRKMWFGTDPMHEVATGPYLIARDETTWADYLAFLESLPPAEQARHAPSVGITLSVQNSGEIGLARDATGWTLTFAPLEATRYTVRAGQKVVYRDRAQRREQDWLKMPVSGISPASAVVYTQWLAQTGRVPGARLCTEREWERAARGVDGRPYPHGASLAPDDANIDVTYGQKEGGFGMDEVGSHPASTSPFGLRDTAGNVWEMTRASAGTDYVMRGGSFFNDAKSAHLANRGPIPGTYAHLHVGLRVCADVSSREFPPRR